MTDKRNIRVIFQDQAKEEIILKKIGENVHIVETPKEAIEEVRKIFQLDK